MNNELQTVDEVFEEMKAGKLSEGMWIGLINLLFKDILQSLREKDREKLIEPLVTLNDNDRNKCVAHFVNGYLAKKGEMER